MESEEMRSRVDDRERTSEGTVILLAEALWMYMEQIKHVTL